MDLGEASSKCKNGQVYSDGRVYVGKTALDLGSNTSVTINHNVSVCKTKYVDGFTRVHHRAINYNILFAGRSSEIKFDSKKNSGLQQEMFFSSASQCESWHGQWPEAR